MFLILFFSFVSMQAMETQLDEDSMLNDIANYILQKKVRAISDKQRIIARLEEAIEEHPGWKEDLIKAYEIDEDDRFMYMQKVLNEVMDEKETVICWQTKQIYNGLEFIADIYKAMPKEILFIYMEKLLRKKSF